MKKLTVIAILFILVSCSVKKRIYRDGYYIDWATHKKPSQQKLSTHKEANSPLKLSQVAPDKTELASVSIPDEPNFLLSKKSNPLFILSDSCGDIITFKSGDIINAKVYEINDEKIKYKRCDNLEGPLFVVSKNTVQSVKYINGVIDVIESNASVPVYKETNRLPSNPSNLKTHPMASWSLALFIAGFIPLFIIIPWIISLVMAANAIDEMEAEPNMYKGMRMAKTVRAFDIIFLFLVVAILLLLLLSVFF